MESKVNTFNEFKFSKDAVTSLREAIKYFRVREGNFSSEDKLIPIIAKLDQDNIGHKDFDKNEISQMLIVIDENIEFMDKYEGYKLLPNDVALNLKQRILLPLYQLKQNFIQST